MNKIPQPKQNTKTGGKKNIGKEDELCDCDYYLVGENRKAHSLSCKFVEYWESLGTDKNL